MNIKELLKVVVAEDPCTSCLPLPTYCIGLRPSNSPYQFQAFSSNLKSALKISALK